MKSSDLFISSGISLEIWFLRDEDVFKSSFCTEFFTAQSTD